MFDVVLAKPSKKRFFSAYELGHPKDKIDDFTKFFLMDLIANNYNMDVFEEHQNILIGRYFGQNNIQLNLKNCFIKINIIIIFDYLLNFYISM